MGLIIKRNPSKQWEQLSDRDTQVGRECCYVNPTARYDMSKWATSRRSDSRPQGPWFKKLDSDIAPFIQDIIQGKAMPQGQRRREGFSRDSGIGEQDSKPLPRTGEQAGVGLKPTSSVTRLLKMSMKGPGQH